jgi:hypothetical protein
MKGTRSIGVDFMNQMTFAESRTCIRATTSAVFDNAKAVIAMYDGMHCYAASQHRAELLVKDQSEIWNREMTSWSVRENDLSAMHVIFV